MHTRLAPGTYVVAVSGGVDSVALLDMLQKQASLRLVVAHFDHGIRDDSADDLRHVRQLAAWYGLPFVSHAGFLGPNASEAVARKRRYEFLHQVRRAANARAIVTAHHQDDLVETAVVNMVRGTGRRGLSALKSTDVIKRPLLHRSKQELIEYAKERQLAWREDSTNVDTKYLRNHIRHEIIPRLDSSQRAELLRLIRRAHDLNEEIEAHLVNHLHVRLDKDVLDRAWFIQLPHTVAREVMHAWLRRHKIKDIDRKTIERLVVAAKAYQQGKRIHIDKQHTLWVRQSKLAITHTAR